MSIYACFHTCLFDFANFECIYIRSTNESFALKELKINETQTSEPNTHSCSEKIRKIQKKLPLPEYF